MVRLLKNNLSHHSGLPLESSDYWATLKNSENPTSYNTMAHSLEPLGTIRMASKVCTESLPQFLYIAGNQVRAVGKFSQARNLSSHALLSPHHAHTHTLLCILEIRGLWALFRGSVHYLLFLVGKNSYICNLSLVSGYGKLPLSPEATSPPDEISNAHCISVPHIGGRLPATVRASGSNGEGRALPTRSHLDSIRRNYHI